MPYTNAFILENKRDKVSSQAAGMYRGSQSGRIKRPYRRIRIYKRIVSSREAPVDTMLIGVSR
jgi:hypothetical protein